MAGQRPAPGQLTQHQAPALELVVLAQTLQRGDHLVELGPGGLGQRVGAHRLGTEEQQRLECGLQGQTHATWASRAWAAGPAASGAAMVISPNGSSRSPV